MIDATDNWWLAILVAATAGLVGGLAYELMQKRGKQTGVVEAPGGMGGRLYDLGVGASLVIGAIAAVAFMYFNPPNETTVVSTDATGASTSETSQEYPAIELIAISLIVGSAGSSVLSGMQAKVKAAIDGQSLELMSAATREVKTKTDAVIDPATDTDAQAQQAAGAVDALTSIAAAATGAAR